MSKRTVIRVKRRRDEPPPPSIFTLQPSAQLSQPPLPPQNDKRLSPLKLKKQKKEELMSSDAVYLTHLMHNSNFLKEGDHQLHSTIPNHISTICNETKTPVDTADLKSKVNAQRLPIEKKNDSANSSASMSKKDIVFRRINPNDAFRFASSHTSNEPLSLQSFPFPKTTKPSMMENNGCKKRKLDVVQVVEARLESIMDSNNRQICTKTEHQGKQSLHHENEDEKIEESTLNPHQHVTKRKRISLQMVETRIMTETEFLNVQRQQQQEVSPTFVKERQQVMCSNRLRERMKRNAAVASSGALQQKKKSKNTILDPLCKRIDESLCAFSNLTTTQTTKHQQGYLHSVTITDDSDGSKNHIISHLHLLQSNLVPKALQSKYLNWSCTNGTGTFLHCTALWNCTDTAKYLCKEYESILDINVLDDGGQTAREVAEMCGSRGIVEVIDRYERKVGLNIITDGIQKYTNNRGDDGYSKSQNNVEVSVLKDQNAEESEGQDYVYDLYCCEGDEQNQDATNNNKESMECQVDEQRSEEREKLNNVSGDREREIMINTETRQKCSPVVEEAKKLSIPETQESSSAVPPSINATEIWDAKIFDSHQDTENSPITVEMYGSVGYWDKHGELVIEACNIPNTNYYEATNGKDAHMATNDYEEDDLDSNCEGFDGNDYPDEESEIDDVWYLEMSADESDSDGYNSDTISNYRNRPVDLGNYDHDIIGGDENDVNFRNQSVDLSDYDGFDHGF